MPVRALAAAILGLAALATPAAALTNDNGIIVFTHADALAGGVTPGDTPGYPVTISAPGSYRLGSGLSVAAGTGIDITGAEVTLDFAGFRIIGSGTASVGVRLSQRAATIRNGTIRAFAQYGISNIGFSASTTTIENMRFADMTAGAININLESANTRIIDNSISGGNYGIACLPNCHIEGNTIINVGIGISVAFGAILRANLIANNNKAIAVVDAVPVGFGDNTIIGNANASTGPLQAMSPNACDPVC